MKITEVISRAQQDPQFAADLHAKALAAAQTGLRSAAFNDLLGEFASSPEELTKLVNNQTLTNLGTTTITTVTTTGTVTTLPCGFTTTTTTTTTTGAAEAVQ